MKDKAKELARGAEIMDRLLSKIQSMSVYAGDFLGNKLYREAQEFVEDYCPEQVCEDCGLIEDECFC
jgi:hypothetical protein